MSKPITPGSFNDGRATSRLVGGQEGYARRIAAWRERFADDPVALALGPAYEPRRWTESDVSRADA